LLAVLLAAASSASAAPSLSAPPCVGYQGDARTLPVQGSGFVPGAYVSVRYEAPQLGEPRSAALVTADAGGSFSTTLVPPSTGAIRINSADFTLSALDPLRPELFAAVPFQVVRVRATVQPRASTDPARRARFFAVGFPQGDRVFAHFVRFGASVASNTISMGRARGACGEVRRRMALVPGRNVARGSWILAIDTQRRYSPRTRPQASASIVIQRRPPRRR
jgi:hypothetical protein